MPRQGRAPVLRSAPKGETRVEVLYFTDPYCSWCWATEPQLLRLLETYGHAVSVQLVMGGLVPEGARFGSAADRKRFFAWLKHHFAEIGFRTAQPIAAELADDLAEREFSTWPACVAVRAALDQDPEVGARFLRLIRRKAYTERAVLDDPEPLVALARKVEGLDAKRLEGDLATGRARLLFEKDRDLCRAYGVTGFPTMLFRPPAGAEPPAVRLKPDEAKPTRPRGPGGREPQAEFLQVVGHRDFETLRQAIAWVDPSVTPTPPRPYEDLLSSHGPLTTRELAEVHGKPLDLVEEEMQGLVEEGRALRVEVAEGELWSLTK